MQLYSMKRSQKYAYVRRKALEIMANVYDPFHDHMHAREVEATALRLYKLLPQEKKRHADPHTIKLLAVLHDTSREVIGTNLFLEPVMGGYISGWIAYRLMQEAGFSYEESVYVRGIIRNHESFLGLWKYPMDINGKILSDADTIETYSLTRLKRGLRYFKQKKFSNILLNIYVFGLILTNMLFSPFYYLKESKVLEKEQIKNLKIFLELRKKTFAKMLYYRVFRLLYSRISIHK